MDTTRRALLTLWTDGYAAFNEWRKTDLDYLTTRAADAHVHCAKSHMRVAELDWLAEAVEGAGKAVSR